MKELRVVVCLIGLYIAAYVAMLDPIEEINQYMGKLMRSTEFKVPAYHIDGDWVNTFFAPANRLDRAVRPWYRADREIK